MGKKALRVRVSARKPRTSSSNGGGLVRKFAQVRKKQINSSSNEKSN